MNEQRLLRGARAVVDAGSVNGRVKVYEDFPELLQPEAPQVLRSMAGKSTETETADLCNGIAQVLELLQQARGVARTLATADEMAGVTSMLNFTGLDADGRAGKFRF